MSIFLKQSKYKNGKIYLSIVNGYYDSISKNSKQIVIEKIGYLDELMKTYDNPIEYFKNKADLLNNEKNSSSIINETIDLNCELDENDIPKNIGYLFIKIIYQELGLDKFFKNKNSNYNFDYDLNKIFSLLVFSRILFPGSKKDNFENKDRFFEPFSNFELTDVYRSLDYFNSFKEEIELLIWDSTKDSYHRDTSRTYYDCTNYYFEINYNDTDLCNENGEIIEKGYRKRGPEKNHRPDPIVELGLLMDSNDIPLSYDLFPGNESEKLSLKPIVKRTKGKFGINRTIVVADRGLNTSDNIFYLAGKNDNNNTDGYIYGQSIRSADKEFKEWVLNQDGYISEPIYNNDGTIETFRKMIFDKDDKCIGYEKKPCYFKHKSRIYPKELTIIRDGKRNTKVRTDQKQMVYYSQKYADKQKRDRNQMIERAKDLIANPKKYNRVTATGAASYINNIKFNSKTGEVIDGLELSLKLDKINEEEKYDGYYSIVTSELNMSDDELRKKYRGLSKIEDSFKITKTELKTRPVYVWTKDHIESHFLTCFVALVILRLLEKRTNNKIPISRLIDSMKNFNAIIHTENIYKLCGVNKDMTDIISCFNMIDLKKFMTREKIRKILKY
mgnify:FL=1